MAYSTVNKTGCCERKGNLQIRFDFFLEKDDPRYSDCIVDVPISEYDGRVDKDGNPIQKDYDKWFASVEKSKQLNPFHSHFVYFDPDVTDDEIKAEMDYHLPNFYKAYQEQWDKVAGGMRHGFAVEKRLGCLDYSQVESKTNFELRKTQVNSRLALLSDIQSKPISIDGKFYPATEIDVGGAAIDRDTTSFASNTTSVNFENPANDTGTLDTIEIWAVANMTGTNNVGTYYGSATTYTSRDYATMGSITAGSKQTITGQSIDVSSGDFVGIYFNVGQLERSSSGYAGIAYKTGDQSGTGEQTGYNNTLLVGCAHSLYATGETAGAIDYPINSSCGLDLGVSVTKYRGWIRSSTSGLDLGASATRAFTSTRTSTSNLSLTTIVTRAFASVRASTSNISLAISNVINKGKFISSTVGLKLSSSATRTFASTRNSSAGLKLASTVTRLFAPNRNSTTNLSLATSVTKSRGWLRTSLSNLGLGASVTRKFDSTRTSTAGLDLGSSVTRAFATIRSSTSNLSLTTSVTRVFASVRTATANLSLSTLVTIWTTVGAVMLSLKSYLYSLTLKKHKKKLSLKPYTCSLTLEKKMSILEIVEGMRYQTSDEEIVYTVTTTNVGSSPSGVSVKAYDTGSESDVTSTVFPTNTPSVASDVITLSPLKSLTRGHVYRVEVKFSSGTSIFERYFIVTCEK